MTLTIPDDLAKRLEPFNAELSRILELGIREWNAQNESGFAGVTEVLETLASLPSADEVMALRPSPSLQARIDKLLEKNRESGLSADEEAEWQRYQYIEHLVRLAKSRAALKLQGDRQ
jgi:hypothetical protein